MALTKRQYCATQTVLFIEKKYHCYHSDSVAFIFPRKKYSYMMVGTAVRRSANTLYIQLYLVSNRAPRASHCCRTIESFSIFFILELKMAAAVIEGEKIAFEDVDKFFSVKTENNVVTSVCKKCNKSFSGKLQYNNRRHLELVHHFCIAPKKNKSKASDDQTVNLVKATVYIDPQKMRKGFVEMVTLDGRPFVAVEDGGLRKITEPIFDALKKANFGFTMNRHRILDDMDFYASKVKEYIKTEIRNKPISIMLDIATRYGLSVMGVSLQFVANGDVQVRHLSMMELKTSHSGPYVCTCLLEILRDFDIAKQYVFSITTDNGANVKNSSDLLEFFQNDNELQLVQNALENVDLNENVDNDDEEWTNDNGDENALNEYNTVFEEAAQQMAADVNDGRTFPRFNLLQIVACAAHTLELAIQDTVEVSRVEQNLLYDCREMMKLLRTPKYSNMLKLWSQNHDEAAEKLKRPVIDNKTRWSSKWKMVLNTFKFKINSIDCIIYHFYLFVRLPVRVYSNQFASNGI